VLTPVGPFALMLRRAAWADAKRAFDAMPEAEAKKPAIRYARARTALEVGSFAEVLPLLNGLERDLPLLTDLIAEARAQAQLQVGPFADAAQFFERQGSPRSLLLAARGYDRAQVPDRVAAAASRYLQGGKRPSALEEEARALRLRSGDAASQKDDAKWLLTHAQSADALASARKVLGGVPDKAQLLERSKVLAGHGRYEDALASVKQAEEAGATELELCHAKADAAYRNKDHYGDAAQFYAQCARLPGSAPLEDSFLSARALLRADRDAEAIVEFRKIAERHPATTQGAEAAYLVGRTHALHGRFSEAKVALGDYLRKYPSGADRKDAQRYQALSALAAKEYKLARRLLEDLAASTADTFVRARYENLSALAAYEDGDKMHATARWMDLARNHPLDWVSAVARARLRATGATPPPHLDLPVSTVEAQEPPVRLPPPSDLLHALGLDDDAERALLPRENVLLGGNPAARVQTLCQAYGELQRGKRMHQLGNSINAATFREAPQARSRWAWACVYPRPYLDLVESVTTELALPAPVVYGIMRQESGFDPQVLSPVGAVGLMQLMPDTAKKVAEDHGLAYANMDLTHFATNVRLGTWYLKELHERLSSVAKQPLPLAALAAGAYNAGPEAIERWAKRMHGVSFDVFVELVPYNETRGYIARVLSNWMRYAYFYGGDDQVPQVDLTQPW
jgi:soluble lytic murein transglycosylase